MKPRLTEAEFDTLKRKRDESVRACVERVCEEYGWDPKEVVVHRCAHDACYCACPDGPCQHIWDGPQYTSDDGNLVSSTCSRCGMTSFSYDMRYAP